MPIPNNKILDAEQSKVWSSLEVLKAYLLEKKPLFFNKEPHKGVYMWGNVGVGKTMLMDDFYNNLSISRKIRLHFQHFMKSVHEQLYQLPKQQNPLKTVAESFAKQYDIICLDELYVDDIVDASMIASMLQELYRKRIVLVITTNLAPDDLYKNGLDRGRFLPAIELIKQHSQVFHLNGIVDYRLLNKPDNSVFFWGDSATTENKLRQYFLGTSNINDLNIANGTIALSNSQVAYKAKTNNTIWFDFSELCEKPRGQLEYIAIAQQFKTVLISGIPQLDDGNKSTIGMYDDRTRRFISLIDEFYDRSILLVASFKCPLNSLYLGAEYQFQFKRVYSRLIEMQSIKTLAKTSVEL